MSGQMLSALYYITHIDNLPSIFKYGILSHDLVEQKKIDYRPIYDSGIVNSRRERQTPDGKSLWEFANLYFQPRNAMLYRVMNENKSEKKNSIAILRVRPSVLNRQGNFVVIGNAASLSSEILPVMDGLQVLKGMKKVLEAEYWTDNDGSKRKMMAECLVLGRVEPEMIDTVYVAEKIVADKIQADFPTIKVPIVSEPHTFFQPSYIHDLTSNLKLVDGDMFFSHSKTLTISVNTKGVMGKGLASRTKYQFPDVYVAYQDLCKAKKLKMGLPYLYKREASLDEMLADDPTSLRQPNSVKWFLLFPTKTDWRSDSDLEGIEEGLLWLKNNYVQQGITSLSLPALGCGLGNLKWSEVGPLICRYLVDTTMKINIYLPREETLTTEMRSKEFLLGAQKLNS